MPPQRRLDLLLQVEIDARDEVVARLGEPYLTTRARNTAPESDAPGGLGLGIFIAKTLLERTGAKLAFENAPSGGAKVRILWPRKLIDG